MIALVTIATAIGVTAQAIDTFSWIVDRVRARRARRKREADAEVLRNARRKRT